eukprot:Platyproteum_vivax@DN16264_c0_g1_i1.p1
MEKQPISFDSSNKIRILPSAKYDKGEELQKACQYFVENMEQFGATVGSLLHILGTQSQEIDELSLKCIGNKLRVNMEEDTRKHLKLELEKMLKDKESELKRLDSELASLVEIEKKQNDALNILRHGEVEEAKWGSSM